MKVGIFDLDGTIADSMDLWERIGELYLIEKRMEVPGNFNESLKELSLEEGIRYIKEEVGLITTIDQVKREIKDMLMTHYKDAIKLKPFAMELLEKLGGMGIRLVLATATDKSLAKEFLKSHGIYKYFESIYTPENIGYSKNQAEFFETIIKRLDLDVKDIWVFEDAFHAIVSAKECGLNVVAIRDNSALKEEDKIREVSDIYIENFKELEVYNLWKNY